MTHDSYYGKAGAFLTLATLAGWLVGCEARSAPGEPELVAPLPVLNKVDDPATIQNARIETVVAMSDGHTFRVRIDEVEVSSPTILTAGSSDGVFSYAHPQLVASDRIDVEVLTVEGWQPTTLENTSVYPYGRTYTHPDGSYRPYYGMEVLDDGRIVYNDQDNLTIDEIPRTDIDTVQYALTATPSLPSRLCSIFVDHRTQEEATLSLGAWQIKLPADFHGLLTPPVLQSTQSIEVNLDGQHLGTIALDPFDPELSFVNPQWLIDTTSRRQYAAYLEHYSDMPVFDYSEYGVDLTPASDSQYTSFSGQAVYSMPFVIDYFLQAAPDSVMVETYGGAYGGSTSRGVLEEVSVGYSDFYTMPQP